MDEVFTDYREFDHHHREGYLIETRLFNNVQDTLCVIKRISDFTPPLTTFDLSLHKKTIFISLNLSFILYTDLWKTHDRLISIMWSYIVISLSSSPASLFRLFLQIQVFLRVSWPRKIDSPKREVV